MADLEWYVAAGNPGGEIDEYCSTIDEVMDYCGRLLYGNHLIDVYAIRIVHTKCDYDKAEWQSPSEFGRNEKWIMTIVTGADGTCRKRAIATKHEVFAMLLVELRTGAQCIFICCDPDR